MIRFVSVTSSKIGSRSSGIGVGTNSSEESKQAEFAEQVKDFKEENADLEALSDGF